MAERMRWHLRKEAAPLRKSLDDLDQGQLGSYVLAQAVKIENADVEAELGTKDYIQWYLEDTTVGVEDPLRNLLLFVTYYTGEVGKVPHVPEVCYQGGGSLIQDKHDATIEVVGVGATDDMIPVRIVTMKVPSLFGATERRVLYFFRVNGTYRCDRNAVRRLQHNLSDRHAFFSKFEVSFLTSKPVSQDAALAAMERLSRQILPVLVEEHWPDWEALEGE